MVVQMFLILLGAMAGGSLLIVLGLRGKRLNQNPICRDCAFDLIAVPAGTITCPECGAGLKRERAIRIGARRKRPVFLGLGAALLLLPLAPLGTVGYGLLTGQDLNKWKPVGLLLWEGKVARGPSAQAAVAEILDRYTTSKLSKEQSERVVQLALDVQGDPSALWTPEWADIIEAADAAKALSKDDHARYRKQAPVLEVASRSRVRSGGQVPVLIKLKEGRVGNTAAFMCMLTLKGAKVGDRSLKRWTPPSTGPFAQFTGDQLGWMYLSGAKSPWGWQKSYGEAGLLLALPGDLPLGRHTLEVTVLTQTKSQTGNVNWGPPKGKDVQEHTLRFALDVVDAADAIEKIKPTPELEEKFQLALTPSSTMVWDSGGSGLGGQQQFSVDSLPAPVSFDVIWKVGDKEWNLGALTSGKGVLATQFHYPGQEDSRTVNAMVPGFRGKKIDVILRPNESALAFTLDQTRLYDGEIILQGVEVERQDTGVSGTTIFTAPARSIFRSLFGG